MKIPASLRERFSLAAGDLVEFGIEGDKIVIRRLPATDRRKAWRDLMAIVNRPRERAVPEMTPEQEEEWIAEAVASFRRDHPKGRD